MVVSFNTANISRNPSSSIAFGNSNKSTARFSAQEGDKFIATGISHKSPVMRKLATWAVGLLALGGAYSCTPEDINPPVKPTTTDTIPKSPGVIDSTSIVVTPSVVNGPMSDYKLSPIAKIVKENYCKFGLIDSTMEAGALMGLKTREKESGYVHTIKFEYPKNDPNKVIIYDVVTDEYDPKNILTVFITKEECVVGDTPNTLKALTHLTSSDGKEWNESKSIYKHKFNSKSLVDIVDNDSITKKTVESPTQIKALYIPDNYRYSIDVVDKTMKDTIMNVSTSLITPRAVKRVIR